MTVAGASSGGWGCLHRSNRLLVAAVVLLAAFVAVFVVLQRPANDCFQTQIAASSPSFRSSELSSAPALLAPSSASSTNGTSSSSDPLFPPLCSPRVGPRVLIASSDNREHDWPAFPAQATDYRDQQVLAYTTWAMLSHRLYAMMHGYDYYKAQGQTRPALDNGSSLQYRESPARKDAWAKQYAARRLLPLYDVLVLLDNDAYFVQPERSLVSFLDQYVPGFLSNDELLMVVSRDNPASSQDDLVNSGVSIIKNTDKSRRMLDRIWTAVWEPLDNSLPLPDGPDFLVEHCKKVQNRRRTDFKEVQLTALSTHSHHSSHSPCADSVLSAVSLRVLRCVAAAVAAACSS